MGVHKKILTEDERNVFLDKFNKLIEIFSNTTLSNDEKVHMFLDVYSTVRKFEVDYEYFLGKCGLYEGFDLDKIKLEELYKQIVMYDNNGMISNLKYIIKIEDIISNYDYAEYIINSYISMDNSYISNFFYHDMDIDDAIFNYCVKIIKVTNPVLYYKYEEKKIENIKKRFNDRVNSLKEIANGIKTGKLSDGSSFDILQFWKLVPFKYFHGLQMELHEYNKYVDSRFPLVPDSSFYRNIRNLINLTLPEEKETILGYMNKNGTYRFSYISINEVIKEQKNTTSLKKVFPNGDAIEIDFDKDDIIQIFNYMNYHKLPHLAQVYSELRERYLNGEDLSVPEVKKYEDIPLILDEDMELQKENIKVLIKKKK